MKKNVFQVSLRVVFFILLYAAATLGANTPTEVPPPYLYPEIDQRNWIDQTSGVIYISTKSASQSFRVQQTGYLTSIYVGHSSANGISVKFSLYKGDDENGTLEFRETFNQSLGEYDISPPVYVKRGEVFSFVLESDDYLDYPSKENSYPYGEGYADTLNYDIDFETYVEKIVFPMKERGPKIDFANIFTGAVSFDKTLGEISAGPLTFSVKGTYNSRFMDLPNHSVLGFGWYLKNPVMANVGGTYYLWKDGQYYDLVKYSSDSNNDYYVSHPHTFNTFKRAISNGRWEMTDPEGTVYLFGDTTIDTDAIITSTTDSSYSFIYLSKITDLHKNTLTFHYHAGSPFGVETSATLSKIESSSGETVRLRYSGGSYEPLLSHIDTYRNNSLIKKTYFDFQETINLTPDAEKSPITYAALSHIWDVGQFDYEAVPATRYTYYKTGDYNGFMKKITIPEAENVSISYRTLKVDDTYEPAIDTITLDHGFGTSSTYFSFIEGNMDPYSHTPRAQSLTVQDSDSQSNGYLEYTLLNDAESPILEGLISKAEEWNSSGNRSSTNTYTWGLTNGDAHGTSYILDFARLKTLKTVRYFPDSGETTKNIQTVDFTYNNGNGLLASSTQLFPDLPMGKITQTYNYGIDDQKMQSSLKALNQLTPITKSEYTQGTYKETTTTDWNQQNASAPWLPSRVTAEGEENGQKGNATTVQITSRNSSGNITQMVGPDGVILSSQYDRTNKFLLAEVTNAPLGKWSYMGFEPYEDQAYATLNIQQSHSGAGCLLSVEKLESNKSIDNHTAVMIDVSETVTQNFPIKVPDSDAYTLSVWYRIPSSGSVKLGFDKNHYVTSPFDAQPGKWHYLTYTASNMSGKTPFVSVKAASADDAVMVPQGAMLSGHIYNPSTNIEVMSFQGDQSRFYLYDADLNPIIRFNDNQTIEPFITSYTSSADIITSPNPDLSTSISWFPRGQGTVSWIKTDFSPWTLHDEAVITKNMVLLDSSQKSYTNAITTSIPRSSYMTHIQFGTITNELEIAIGSTSFHWNNGTWESQSNGITTVLETQTAAPSFVTFYNNGTTFMLLSNGKILSTQPITQPLSTDTIRIAAPPYSSVEILYTVLAENPEIEATFYNTAGDPKQLQSLSDDNQITVTELLLDNYGRHDTTTKPMNYPGLFEFKPSLVTSYDRQTGIMTGEVSDTYPNDNQHPYHRTIFQSEPIPSPKEWQLPGTIPNTALNTTTKKASGEQQETRSFTGLGADKTTTQHSFTGQPLNETLGSTQSYKKTYSTANSLSKITWESNPNSTQGTTSYDTTFQRNADQDVTSQTLIDFSHPLSRVYDSLKRVVFYGSEGLSDINYIRYNAFNQPIEEGVYQGSWDTAALQSIANNMTNPAYQLPSNMKKFRIYTYHYSETNPLGILTEATAIDTNSNQIRQTFHYDNQNRITKTDFSATQFNTKTYTLNYSYDKLGNRTRLDYTTATGTPSSIVYSYDETGRVESIGTTNEPELYATYRYTPSGKIAQKTLNNRSITINYTYDSAENLTKLSSPQLELTYNYLNSQNVYQNGWLQNASVTYSTTGGGTAYTKQEAYEYDSSGQLLSTLVNNTDPHYIYYDSNGNIKNQYWLYDSLKYQYQTGNNKISTLTINNTKTLNFRYIDSLAAVDRIEEFAYNSITAFYYDVFTKMPSSIASSTFNISYSFGPDNERSYKKTEEFSISGATKTLYIRGIDDYPIQVLTEHNGQLSETDYVYGPDGIVAIIKDNQRHAILSDKLGSTRVILDSSNTVKAQYDYSDFGRLLAIGDSTILTPYLYTGQEYESLAGLYNYRTRFYSPLFARFLSPDPRLNEASPYRFVKNNPLSYVDPDGEYWRLSYNGQGHHPVPRSMIRSHGYSRDAYDSTYSARFYPTVNGNFDENTAGQLHQLIHAVIRQVQERTGLTGIRLLVHAYTHPLLRNVLGEFRPQQQAGGTPIPLIHALHNLIATGGNMQDLEEFFAAINDVNLGTFNANIPILGISEPEGEPLNYQLLGLHPQLVSQYIIPNIKRKKHAEDDHRKPSSHPSLPPTGGDHQGNGFSRYTFRSSDGQLHTSAVARGSSRISDF